MKDPNDTKTHDLLEPQTKARRGRPATGKALSPAEKQKAYRERKKAAQGSVDEMSKTIEELNEEIKYLNDLVESTAKDYNRLFGENEQLKKAIKEKNSNVTGIEFIIKSRMKGKQKWEPFGSEIPGQEQKYSMDEAEDLIKACINGIKNFNNGSEHQYRIEPAGKFIKEFR